KAREVRGHIRARRIEHDAGRRRGGHGLRRRPGRNVAGRGPDDLIASAQREDAADADIDAVVGEDGNVPARLGHDAGWNEAVAELRVRQREPAAWREQTDVAAGARAAVAGARENLAAIAR